MFNKLFGKPKDGTTSTSAISTLERIGDSLGMLEKKEQVLQRKIAMELQKAMEFTKAKNKRAAINCLKRKKLFEAQVEQLAQYQLRLHDQMILLEGAKATTDTVDALRSGANAMKAIQKATNIDDVDRTMESINEQQDNMKQIQEALSTPVGPAAEFDDDELEAELEELEDEDLNEDLPAATTKIPTAPQPVRAPAPLATRPAPTPPQKTPAYVNEENDELEALQKEMAL
ncbi:unnamed protein product [Calypogeia fissa]